MSNYISKINIGETTYELKDSEARSNSEQLFYDSIVDKYSKGYKCVKIKDNGTTIEYLYPYIVSTDGYVQYYAYGETEEKDYYSWDTYMTSSSNCCTENDSIYKYDSALEIAGSKYDAASTILGHSWQILDEKTLTYLISSEEHNDWSYQWQDSYNDGNYWGNEYGEMAGMLFTSSDGDTFFLPALGYAGEKYAEEDATNFGTDGYYWFDGGYYEGTDGLGANLNCLHFNKSGIDVETSMPRCYGLPILPIMKYNSKYFVGPNDLMNYLQPPTDDGTYMLKVENGTYTWVASSGSSDSSTDSTVGTISEQVITLDSTLASGEYTLKYEDDTNTPLEDWDVIGTITQE